VNLIVGKNAGMKGSYVRRAGEATSWLTSENIEAPTPAHDWLQSSILDIGADRVQSATVTVSGGKPYTLAKSARADADFKIEGLPKSKEPDTVAANNIATALAGLTLAEVRPAQEFAADKPAAHATFKTFDGLVVDLDGWSKDGKHYVAAKTAYDGTRAAQFHVEAKAPEKTAEAEGAALPQTEPTTPTEKAEDTAEKTNARLQGWAYEIAEYKYEAIFRPVDALTKK
jgi:Domain of unknown function (DUF4340)